MRSDWCGHRKLSKVRLGPQGHQDGNQAHCENFTRSQPALKLVILTNFHHNKKEKITIIIEVFDNSGSLI